MTSPLTSIYQDHRDLVRRVAFFFFFAFFFAIISTLFRVRPYLYYYTNIFKNQLIIT